MIDTSTFFRDLRVIELASVLAGPSVGLFFAELGAHVMKIENKATGGDVTRKWKLPSEDPEDPKSAYYHSVNYAKEVIMLNLTTETDKVTALDLIRDADIVISNYKKGSAEKLGMAYSQLKEINPGLIYGSISAYGPEDPRPGFDAVIQAETGWMSMNGQSDGPPTKMPVALIDVLAGHQLKQGILLALLHKMRTGEGCYMDVSLFDASISALNNQASNYLNTGEVPIRKGNAHPNIAPYGDVVQSADGQWLMLAIGNDKQFDGLCELLNIKQLLQDDRFAHNTDRVVNRTVLMEIISSACLALSASDILSQAARHKVPISVIHDMRQLFDDPEAQALILSQKEIGRPDSQRTKTVVFRAIS